MKTKGKVQHLFILTGLLIAVGSMVSFRSVPPPSGDEYIIIGWNDLGMHCANKDFQRMCILPPYNNMYAQIIKKGTETSLPEVVTSGFTVNYSIPGNTYSVGKTNFWDYAQQLFNVNLSPNIGLTGVGLTGTMNQAGNYYVVEGVPITPYQDNDLLNENPYQLALLQATGTAAFSTQNVMPVSNEISCVSSGCHNSEQGILNEHEEEGGFNPANTPILCADCHGSNALGMPGVPEYGSLSYVIHNKHKNHTNNCYKCHPGTNTQCFRDVMHTAGMVCQDCHGNVANVAGTIASGRQPWLNEPSCGSSSCHGSNFAEEPGKLFRQSKGHAGLFCSACHNSPHAILPTSQPNDNVQVTALQGWAGTLEKCTVCHGVAPSGPGPHGIVYTSVEEISRSVPHQLSIDKITPIPVKGSMTVTITVLKRDEYKLQLISPDGKTAGLLYSGLFDPGTYTISFDPEDMPSGLYTCTISGKAGKASKKIVLLK